MYLDTNYISYGMEYWNGILTLYVYTKATTNNND